jgi:hypothetical protein
MKMKSYLVGLLIVLSLANDSPTSNKTLMTDNPERT